MKIKNGQILSDRNNLISAEISFENGLVTEVSRDARINISEQEYIDANNWIVSPGWIDIQINGGFGYDFTTNPESIWDVGALLPKRGITGFLPTIISSPAETYQRAISVLRKGPPAGWNGARPLGWHFEGPFLNPMKKGAHNPDFLQIPNLSLIEDWTRDNDVLLVTMAPELSGAAEIAAKLTAAGVILSAGHTNATIAEGLRAAENGFTAITHLFNAMPTLDHRSPGIVNEALLNDKFFVALIADGLHVHPRMVEMAWRLKGPEKIILISDAVGALGALSGIYTQGGMEIHVSEESARLPNGTLAGSVLTLDKALRNLMQFTNFPIEQILPSLSLNPSKLLKLNYFGEIKPGNKADLTIVDQEGFVKMTLVGGEIFYP